ncbi:MAG: EAL domain-containing protein [Burkholderiales bacterium]|nr:EAL domain-containing protein [Burkholderiales bacterium]
MIRFLLPGIAIGLTLLSSAIPLYASTLYNTSFNSFDSPSPYEAQNLWIGAAIFAFLLTLRLKRKGDDNLGKITQWQSVMESLPFAAALFDRNGRCTEILSTGQDMHGNIWKGHYLHEALPPDSAKRILEAVRKTFDTGTPERFEYALQFSGERQWYEGSTALAGNPRRQVLCVCRDITQPKTAEITNNQERELWLSTLQSLSNGVITTDLYGFVNYLNPEAEKLTGWQRQKAEGAPLSSIFRILHEDSRETAENPALLALRKSGIVRSGNNLLMIRKDGSEFSIDESAAPISDKTGEVVGAVVAFHDITGNNTLLWQASHDALTGLLNRVLLHDRLVHSMASVKRQGKILAVLFLDLDGFKSVNDNLGHPVGDMLLKEVAFRLKAVVRAEDTTARIGGDEFVVLQSASDRSEVKSCLDRIMGTINTPFFMDGMQVSISSSIGVVLYPEIDSEPEMLLRQADMAMYHAKQSGRNRYHFFDQSMSIAQNSNHERQKRISSALKNGELCLFYQPRINLRTGKVAGLEALIRWQDPDLGMLILPRDFLPAVQDTKLIVEIGTWVIETVLGQMQSWQNHGLEINVSINVSGRQIQDPDFTGMLRRLFDKYIEVSPDRIELEILETTAMPDFHLLQQILVSCREIGVKLSLDDFGTGYSSLSYIKKLPVDMLKIDQSFVSDMLENKDNLALIRSILSMSRIFNRGVIAEGMESANQGKMLIRMGCKLAQGYAIAKPMPSENIPEWMESWPQNPGWMKRLH